MTRVPIFWLSNHDHIDSYGPWDTGILRSLFCGAFGSTGVTFDSSWQTTSVIPDGGHDGVGVVVVPARHHYADADIEWLNRELAKLRAGILILCGDEDAKFPWKRIIHDNLRFWVQMPEPRNYADMSDYAYFFGNGFRYGFADAVAAAKDVERSKNWVFAGQVTNPPRRAAYAGLMKTNHFIPGEMLATEGFAQGLDEQDYANLLASAWVAPCPGGPMSVDTFRLYEALESGCVPIVDWYDAGGMMAGYWDMVYGKSVPFPKVSHWDGVGGVIEDILERRHHWSALCSSWWQQQKRAMRARLISDLRGIGVDVEVPKVTALITTSPAPIHPDMSHLVETVESIPDDFDVFIGIDGVRPEQEHLRARYEEYVYRVTRWCATSGRMYAIYDGTWRHQAGTTAHVLNSGLIDSPAILFLEHDTPLVQDMTIDWDACIDLVANAHVDVLRFHHEAHVLPVHSHLMIDRQTQSMLGVPLRRTLQWSQRPHLANTTYYRHILDTHFPPGARTMIEDKMHSVVQSELAHRLAIYHPYAGSILRSYHLDSRGSEDKFDMRFH